MFHMGPGPGGWADTVIKQALKHWTIKSVALVAPNDQGGTDIVSVDEVAYKDNGIKTSSEYYQRGTTNFAPIITRLLAANPDAVDTASSPPGDAGVIVKQLRLAGFKGPIGRNGGPGTEEILRVCGGMGVLKDFYWYNGAARHAADARDRRRSTRSCWARIRPSAPRCGLTCRAARMTLKAISIAGTMDDVQKVAEALRNLPVDDPNMGKGVWSGMKQFGIAQELMFPFGIGIIKDGKELGVTTRRAEAVGAASATRPRACTVFIEAAIIGVGLGAQYALLALGFTLIFGILGVVNFAHGGFLHAGRLCRL